MGSPIWILSSRSRPDEAQEVLNACEATGMSSPGVLYVDETVDEYRDVRLPANWTAHFEPRWGSLQASLQWAYRQYPDATSYGWLADDNRPVTPGWDKLLERAAGDWCLSYANDNWRSHTPDVEMFERGLDLSAGLCWGGELVRTVGWWALPGVVQAGIDTAWLDICQPLDLCRYQPDVVVEHWNWRSGKRPYDAGDEWERPGFGNYIENDIAVKNAWSTSRELPRTRERVRDAVHLHPDSGSPTVPVRGL